MDYLLILLRENAAFVVYLVLMLQCLIWQRLNHIDRRYNEAENRLIVVETKLKIAQAKPA